MNSYYPASGFAHSSGAVILDFLALRKVHRTMWNRLYIVVSFAAAVLTILQLVWAGRSIMITGLQASVPAWLLVATAITASLFGWLLGRKIKASKTGSNSQQFKRVGKIDFDYLPATPTNHGWDLKVDLGELLPELSAALDTPIPGSLLISSKGRYRLDYEVGPSGSLCNFVEFALKPTNGSIVYANIKVRSRDGSESADVWLAHTIGIEQPKRLGPIEWQVSVGGEVLDNEWLLLKLSISDEVHNTFGRDGWVYQSLLRVRLRGSMSISPITLYRISEQGS